MAGDAARLAPMRYGANRVIGFALLASLVLHAAFFALVPQYRKLSALIPPEPEPLIARVERLEPPAPVPQPPVPEVRKLAPPKLPPPKPKPAPREPEPVVAPAPAPAPAAPRFEPRPAPEPAPAPAQAPPPAPLVRVDPRLLLEDAPAPDAQRARALARYGDEMNLAANRFKQYPRAAIDNQWYGEVSVALSVDAKGGIADVRVTSSAGYPVLDRAALEMFRNAHAVVSIPEPLRGRPFEISLHAIYEATN